MGFEGLEPPPSPLSMRISDKCQRMAFCVLECVLRFIEPQHTKKHQQHWGGGLSYGAPHIP